ncbi:MAG TPA: hypothetical protein VM554_03960 [Acidisarcina sp.]|nr:hypothetical protein [Acidisarcina sp.]
MRFFAKLACYTLALFLCHTALAQPGAASAANSNFPVVASYNLDKTKVTLPRDLQGEINLLMLSFAPEQQKDVDSWKPIVKEVETSRPGFRHYLVPVFSRENFLSRWWMNSSLRSRLPANEERKWTIPLYLNRQRFLKQLQIASDQEITLLLVEKSGQILWRTTGALTEEKRAALQEALMASDKAGR